MKALVINLAGETERMSFQADQLTALDLPFERLDAVTPDRLDPPADDAYWTGWQRPLRQTEMAAMASHRGAWDRVLGGGLPCSTRPCRLSD